MQKQDLWNRIIGKQKLDVAPTNSKQLPCHSLHQFYLDNPIPSEDATAEVKLHFYEALHKMDDFFLPEDQKKTRYALLVKLRKDSGIKFDNGVDYHGHQQ